MINELDNTLRISRYLVGACNQYAQPINQALSIVEGKTPIIPKNILGVITQLESPKFSL
jgi:hypothetical protein